MAKIQITLLDDSGKQISLNEFELSKELDSLDKIEASVEELRTQALPQISKALLENAQDAYQKKVPA